MGGLFQTFVFLGLVLFRVSSAGCLCVRSTFNHCSQSVCDTEVRTTTSNILVLAVYRTDGLEHLMMFRLVQWS
ncbi:hypothetical protein BKA64DRAFT_673290 [Cadophora sp. MPI-SDFR-AT-0126]|nr:hypothetical protein BKA64DRAFT_673290 [Leotiomycetes sp. MPI-SDFR-AT-0126]